MRNRFFLLTIATLHVSITGPAIAVCQEEPAATKERLDTWPAGRWTILFPTKAAATPLMPLPNYRIDGPYEDSTLFLSKFAADSMWDVKDRLLQVPEGENAALRLGRAESFELEGTADFSGPGGMFLVVGENEGHGYGVCSTTMVRSGSPWKLFEFRGHQAIPETDAEIAKHEPIRPQPFRVVVTDKKITFTLGRLNVFENVPMPNYHEGDIILGVFDTRYGARKVKIKELRARSLNPEPTD